MPELRLPCIRAPNRTETMPNLMVRPVAFLVLLYY